MYSVKLEWFMWCKSSWLSCKRRNALIIYKMFVDWKRCDFCLIAATCFRALAKFISFQILCVLCPSNCTTDGSTTTTASSQSVSHCERERETIRSSKRRSLPVASIFDCSIHPYYWKISCFCSQLIDIGRCLTPATGLFLDHCIQNSVDFSKNVLQKEILFFY